jgi:hypothetical protein
MMASQSGAVCSLSTTEHDLSYGRPLGPKWVPSPKLRHMNRSLRSVTVPPASTSVAGDPNSQVVALSTPTNADISYRSGQGQVDGMRFGFSAPEDRLTSLNIPAESFYSEKHPSLSFDIEFSQERPDTVTIGLLERDGDGFIHTVHKTVQFPARLLAELLSRRRATAEEASAWQALDGEE